MARYDYRCEACDTVFEAEHAMGEHPEITCPKCGAKATRVFNASGIAFHGSGFYNTDMKDSCPSSSTDSCGCANDSSACACCKNAQE